MQSVRLEKENHGQNPGQEQVEIKVGGGFNLVKQFNVGCDLAQNSRDSVSVRLVPKALQ